MPRYRIREMSRFALLLFLGVVVAPPVLAGPNAGGMLVVHDAGLTYTGDGGFPLPGPTPTCLEVDAELPFGRPESAEGWVWKVYAVFPSAAAPRLKALCFGAEFPSSITVLAGSLPDDMDFEVAMAGWPDLSGYGTMMSFFQVKTGHVNEVYELAGYGELGLWQLIGHPGQITEFVDDSIPPQEDQIMAFGSIGFGEPGHAYCPDGNPAGACCLPDGSCLIRTGADCEILNGIFRGEPYGCDPDPCHVGACCFHQICFVITQTECDLLAGPGTLYLGDLVPCEPFPCGLPMVCCIGIFCYLIQEFDCIASGGVVHPELEFCMPNPCAGGGACCLEDGFCLNSVESTCLALDGIFHPGVQCPSNPCGPTGACCFANGSCAMMTSEHCSAQMGNWVGAGVPCNPDPCEPTPIERTTWGRIKQSYR